jgi:hypothetical protein
VFCGRQLGLIYRSQYDRGAYANLMHVLGGGPWYRNILPTFSIVLPAVPTPLCDAEALVLFGSGANQYGSSANSSAGCFSFGGACTDQNTFCGACLCGPKSSSKWSKSAEDSSYVGQLSSNGSSANVDDRTSGRPGEFESNHDDNSAPSIISLPYPSGVSTAVARKHNSQYFSAGCKDHQ